MGFRTTFISEAIGGVIWHDWFKIKYGDKIIYSDNAIMSSRELKMYSTDMQEFEIDIQKCINWSILRRFIMVYLHECGGITRVQIEQNAIIFTEPDAWKVTENVTHSYCYGCSDASLPYIQGN